MALPPRPTQAIIVRCRSCAASGQAPAGARLHPIDPLTLFRRLLPPILLLALASLACSQLAPATPSAIAGAAVTGQFDCYGTEGGLGAYAGRVTLEPGGAATFKNYDNQVQTGAWTFDARAKTVTFTGSLALASALYLPAADTLMLAFAPNAQVVHAEAGAATCQRAKPGITGPP